MTARVRLALLLLLAAALGGSTFAWSRWRELPPEEAALRVYGHVDVREAQLAFNVPGRIVAMLVDEGARVKTGQLMARLDDAVYRAEVETAEARRTEAAAVLARLVAGSRPEEIEQARATVAEIEAELEDAQRQVQRLQQLALDRFAPQQQLDTARAAAAVARARLEVARQALTLAVKGPRAEEIAAARARLAAETAALAAAQKKLADTQLAAPNPGTVLTRLQEPGNVVQAHTPIYSLALDDPVWVRTYIAEPDLGRVREGTPARILTDGGGVYAGWVGFISPVAEFTPKTVETEELRTSLVYRIRVFAENPDRGLRQGMPVTVELLPAGPTSEPPTS